MGRVAAHLATCEPDRVCPGFLGREAVDLELMVRAVLDCSQMVFSLGARLSRANASSENETEYCVVIGSLNRILECNYFRFPTTK